MDGCKKIKIAAVVGPTASGKTKLAVDICRALSGEAVSCDSMQIYKYMDIGSAKITKEEMDGVVHHMIDEVTPDVPFSVSEFQTRSEKYTKKLFRK